MQSNTNLYEYIFQQLFTFFRRTDHSNMFTCRAFLAKLLTKSVDYKLSEGYILLNYTISIVSFLPAESYCYTHVIVLLCNGVCTAIRVL